MTEQRIKDYVNWLFEHPGTPWPGNRILTHTFWLRPNYRITFDLPCDLRRSEASRVEAMIKVLPLS